MTLPVQIRQTAGAWRLVHQLEFSLEEPAAKTTALFLNTRCDKYVNIILFLLTRLVTVAEFKRLFSYDILTPQCGLLTRSATGVETGEL